MPTRWHSFSVFCLAFAVLAGLALAQDQPPAPPAVTEPAKEPNIRIGTIFAQNAIVSTQEGQKASAALTAKFEPKRREFDQKQNELNNLRDQLKRGAATMSAEVKARLNQAIDAKSIELKRFSEDIQAQVEEQEGALLQELGEKLIKVIDGYALQNGFAVVLDVSAQQGPVLWVAPSIDITSEIVKLYDKAHPVSAAPPALPVPPTKK
jgi:outer membrane protein